MTDLKPERVNQELRGLISGPKRSDEQKSPVFYRTSSPSGPLPCFLSLQFTIMQSRASGIADHILPLGDLLFVRYIGDIASGHLVATVIGQKGCDGSVSVEYSCFSIICLLFVRYIGDIASGHLVATVIRQKGCDGSVSEEYSSFSITCLLSVRYIERYIQSNLVDYSHLVGKILI